ncbi:hypothetical protein [Novosphingobium lindaniclasticum]
MDELLANAQKSGHDPEHWTLRLSDWLKIVNCYYDKSLPNRERFGRGTYRDLPINLGPVDADGVVALSFRKGGKLLTQVR